MSHTQTEQWRRVLRGQGGTVLDLQILIVPEHEVVVLALTPLGLFCSDNRGISWARFQAGDAPPLAQSLALAYDPNTADPTILLGSALGLFRTRSTTAPWTPLFTGLSVEAIGMPRAIDSESLLLAATTEKGLLISDDGGVTWNDANAGLNFDPIVAICFSPLYPSDKTIFLATDSDIFRSRNGGKAWRRLEFEVPPQSIQCMCATTSNHAPPVLFVGSSISGLWSSRDRGASWNEQISNAEIRSISIASAEGDDEFVLVVTGEGVYRSSDSGMTWQQDPVNMPDAFCSIMVPPLSADTLLVGRIDNGVARKSFGNDEWIVANNGLEASPRTQLGVTSCEEEAKHCLIVSDVNNRLLLSRDAGNNWVPTEKLPSTYDNHHFSLFQHTPEHFSVYITTDYGAFEYDTSLSTWTTVLDPKLDKQPLAIVGFRSPDDDEYPPLLTIMTDGEVMYRLPNMIWRSTGRHFGDTRIVAAELIPGGRTAKSCWAIIYSTNDQDELGQSALWNTANGGLSWNHWIQSSASAATLALGVTADASGHDVVFVGMQNTVYKTGLQSTKLVGSQDLVEQPIRAIVGDGNLAVTAIAASPDFSNDATLFVATNLGIYISRNAGITFDRWGVDGPNQILGIQLSPTFSKDRRVYVLELGGSVWSRLDDGLLKDCSHSAQI